MLEVDKYTTVQKLALSEGFFFLFEIYELIFSMDALNWWNVTGKNIQKITNDFYFK